MQYFWTVVVILGGAGWRYTEQRGMSQYMYTVSAIQIHHLVRISLFCLVVVALWYEDCIPYTVWNSRRVHIYISCIHGPWDKSDLYWLYSDGHSIISNVHAEIIGMIYFCIYIDDISSICYVQQSNIDTGDIGMTAWQIRQCWKPGAS